MIADIDASEPYYLQFLRRSSYRVGRYSHLARHQLVEKMSSLRSVSLAWAKLPTFSSDYSCRRKSSEVHMNSWYQFRTSLTLNDEALLSTYLVVHQRPPSTFFWQPGSPALCHGTRCVSEHETGSQESNGGIGTSHSSVVDHEDYNATSGSA
jgi:hypothetical protein